jgi:hypothetical protein
VGLRTSSTSPLAPLRSAERGRNSIDKLKFVGLWSYGAVKPVSELPYNISVFHERGL